uniref:Uncharacterized protein n=1 Tax=Knipowitschia caucasica TaxID=637954 RepID=A0AAV2LPD1_KNICA
MGMAEKLQEFHVLIFDLSLRLLEPRTSLLSLMKMLGDFETLHFGLGLGAGWTLRGGQSVVSVIHSKHSPHTLKATVNGPSVHARTSDETAPRGHLLTLVREDGFL